MRRTGRDLARLGLKGLLSLVGGAAALVGTACGVVPLYGAQPPYGSPSECSGDADCKASHGDDWYCDSTSMGRCIQKAPDAGTSEDAGK